MDSKTWMPFVVALVNTIFIIWLGVLGGELLFDTHIPALEGIGAALIVSVPWVLGELTKDRPPIRMPFTKK